jgi:hypothetical protein
MTPRRALTIRAVWPARAARLLGSAGRRRRSGWPPLSMAWGRIRAAKPAALSQTTKRSPAGIVRLALSIAYSLKWSLPGKLAGPRAAANNPSSKPRFWPAATRRISEAHSGARVDRAASGAVWRLPTQPIQKVRLGETRSILRPALQTNAPLASIDKETVLRADQSRPNKPAHTPQWALRLWARTPNAHTSASAPATPAVQSSRSRQIQTDRLRAQEKASGSGTTMLVHEHHTRLVLSMRKVPQSEPAAREHFYATERHRIGLAWREKPAQADEGVRAARRPAGQGNGASPSVQPPTARPLLASNRSFAAMLEPAVAERLVEDVIRRVDRRMRIERERRGL